MRREVVLGIALSLAACGAARPASPVASTPVATSPVALEPATPPAPPELAAHEIAVEGDGRSVPIALAEGDGGIVLFVSEPTGIGRFAIDVDAATATRTAAVALDRFTALAAYDRASDRLWWVGAEQQLTLRQPSRAGDFPVGDLVLTTSSFVAHTGGLRATVRVCPADTGGLLGAGGGSGSHCDHVIRALLPTRSGIVLGGHLTERTGATSAQPWIALADEQGSLTVEQRLPGAMGQAWIDSLASSDAGVLAVTWSGRPDAARSAFVLLHATTLQPIATAPRTTITSISSPWSAAIAAPDGTFWVALTTHRHELTIVSIARDGSIAAEHAIEGASLPITSVQSLGVRRGEPWLMIAEPYARPSPTVRVARVDPRTGGVPERHEIALPAGFYPSRMLAIDDGFVLAGRVGTERPIVVWVPLARSP